MDPTWSGKVPSSKPPGKHSPKRTKRSASIQITTGGLKPTYAVQILRLQEHIGVGMLDIHQHPRRRWEGGDTATTTKPRPELPEALRQRPRRDSYSGAIEGCSRDHHPEFYPELWPKTNLAAQEHKDTSPTRWPLPSPSFRTNTPSGLQSSGNTSGYKGWLQRSFNRKRHFKAEALNGPSRKGKESPLTMEDRMFFMGIRPRPDGNDNEEPSRSSLPPPPPPPPLAVQASLAASSSMGPTIGGFVTYPQISGYHDAVRVSGAPLVVVNPDVGSEAERVRDEAVREQEGSRTTRGSKKAKGSSVGRLITKRFLRLL